jgi:hypothetical protein
MPVYVRFVHADPVAANAAVDPVLIHFEADGPPMVPVATGDQGTLLFESMHLATPLSDQHLQHVAQATAAVVQDEHQQATLIQNQRRVALTGNPTQNQALIRPYAATNADIVIEIS